MARPPRRPSLAVYLNSRRVGRLRREATGAVDFQYAQDWLSWEQAQPVSLSLPLREDRYVGVPVINVFDNLLPDNAQIRGRIAARVGAEGTDAYSLLTALGRDCVGALQFLPEDQPVPARQEIEGEVVSEDDIARILNDLVVAPLGLQEDEDFRISIAGAQEKTAFTRLGDQWLKPFGTTPTTHIFKPQIGRLPNGVDLSNSVENEYLCLNLMAALGLQAARVEMATFGDRRVLIVERFDRRKAADGRLERVPQEDFCQAMSIPWTLKYERDGGPGIGSGLDLLAASDEPTRDRRAFFKTMVVFWLLGATDGHGKNFSVFLYPGNGFELTPLYDVLSAQPSVDAGQIARNRMKLAMAVGDNRHYQIDDIVGRHFLQSAAGGGLGEGVVHAIFAELVETGPAAIETVMERLPADFPQDLADSVTRGFLARLRQLADI